MRASQTEKVRPMLPTLWGNHITRQEAAGGPERGSTRGRRGAGGGGVMTGPKRCTAPHVALAAPILALVSAAKLSVVHAASEFACWGVGPNPMPTHKHKHKRKRVMSNPQIDSVHTSASQCLCVQKKWVEHNQHTHAFAYL